MITVFDTGGVLNAPPVITELQLVGEPTQTSAEISYKVSDADKQIVRHFITIPGLYEEKEITKDVGYEQDTYKYTITGLTKNTTYSVVITCSDGLAKANSEALQIKTKNAILYSFTINEADSNPATRVGYGDEAVGVSPATSTGLGGWESKWPFNVIRIVAMQKGKVLDKDINASNRAYFTDGTKVYNADASASDPINTIDTMTEFPTIYWRKSAPSGQIKFDISDYPIVGGDCYAHKVGGVVRSKIYVGCYLGSLVYKSGGKYHLVSVSGKLPDTNTSLSEQRIQANLRGSGYELLNFNIVTMLQILFTLAYRNTNSQSSLGMGYVGASAKATTGGTDTKGWVYGSTSQTEQMCFLGIEDLWGNLYQWVDGMKTDADYNIWFCTDNVNFNDTGTGEGWEKVENSIPQAEEGWLKGIDTSGKTGFIPKTFSASSTTYYCDIASIYNNRFSYWGGSYNDSYNAGIFYLSIYRTASETNTRLGARLVYIGEVTA